MKIGAVLPRIHWCNRPWESLTNRRMFHSPSNHKAIESTLMRDEKICRHNQVISSQACYINGIHISIANTRTKRSHNQRQWNKLVAQSQSHEQNSQNNDTFRHESLHSKCEHQKHNFIAQETHEGRDILWDGVN